MTGLFPEDVSPYFKRDLLTLLPGRYKVRPMKDRVKLAGQQRGPVVVLDP
jgi:hypothetical protein